MNPRNWISVFTEEELRAALNLVGTAESAAAVAAELYALPPEEQAHFDWIDGTLLMLSCVSDDVARRVFEHFASSPEERARMEIDRQRYCQAVQAANRHGREAVLSLDDIVCDSRKDVTWMTEARASGASGRDNFIDLFTETELREALTLLGPPDEAAEVAARLYALPLVEQSRLNWTDVALGLLSTVSDGLANRVLKAFGTTPERVEEIREMQGFWRRMADSGELKDPRVHLDLDMVVRTTP